MRRTYCVILQGTQSNGVKIHMYNSLVLALWVFICSRRERKRIEVIGID